MYTAEELRKAGVEEETAFSHIGFYIQTRPGLPLPQFRLRMRNTTAIDLSEHDDGPFDTTQIIASFNPPDGGWHMIELQEPFVWNGVDNILIDTAFPQLFIENRTGQVRINQAPNGYRYVRRSSSTVDAETTSFENYRPQIRLMPHLEIEAPMNPPRELAWKAEGAYVIFEWQEPEDTNATLLGYYLYNDADYKSARINKDVTSYQFPIWTLGVEKTFHVTAMYEEGESEPSNKETVVGSLSEDDINAAPIVTRLGNNYPNPFNPSTTIYFDLNENGFVRLDVFNIRGQMVRTLVEGDLIQGRHFTEWNGLDNSGNYVGSGLYLYRLETNNHSETRRMILMK